MTDTDELVAMFGRMTLSEITEFRRKFEETFGVTADSPVSVVDQPPPAEEVEEQTEFDVLLTGAGAKKIAVIKAVREIRKDLALGPAKELVDSLPVVVSAAVPQQEAERIAAHLRTAGARVEIR